MVEDVVGELLAVPLTVPLAVRLTVPDRVEEMVGVPDDDAPVTPLPKCVF